jgi:DNA mismatch endonuclease (patch repair protein)
VAIHVDGVWWHGHPAYFRPGLRGPYWDKKIVGNMRRDQDVDRQLQAMGWKSLRLWDIDVLHKQTASIKKILKALESRGWRKA